ncbi:alanine/arginine aminopeptidase [Scheffersomyces coipomensis]|uniref:alanine/arginine aminopeptidase n=1 Tax=Scheffersomyces coipomensis TaxID=1788519 RepID=UPI00315D0466
MCRHTNNSTDGASLVPSDREVLPNNVKPLHYDLTIEPIFENFTFTGEETVDFHVIERTDYITLNSLEIEIQEAKLNDVTVPYEFDVAKQTVTFKFDDHLVEGADAKLYLKFTGTLNENMCGFYRSSYKDNGVTKYLATTQMEATDCRKAFPCYDQPAAKAKFTINIVTQKELTALSNMDVRETTLLGDDKKVVSFNTTPIMSTYLVAFVVGELKYVENNDYRVPIKVYATADTENLGVYAGEIAAKTLKFFDKKFDIEYPLPKLDMVAIPDFAAGAMENYGLVTYRTVDLLIDTANTNAATQQRVTEVVMHELAHQWFGNLVTMEFWDGLWLNEGFATWMSWYAADALFPDWKVWESYVSDNLQQALSLDSLRASHPIEVPVKRVDQISQIFDAISYSKGCALLKMVSKWLGEEVFVSGVSLYLKRFKWGNTYTSDLWDALSEVSGKDVNTVMNIWTKNVGHPLVKVEEVDDKLVFTQNRFLTTGDVKPEEDQILYPVFLGIRTSEGIDETVVLSERSITIPKPANFVKINADHSGVYRTAYEPARWTQLGEAGAEGKLTVEDRVGLVSDASALVSSGLIEATALFNLVRTWTEESNYVVWESILAKIASVKSIFIFDDESIKEGIDAFVLDLIAPKLKEVGWEFSDKDSFSSQKLKSVFFASAVSSGHKEAVEFAANAFEAYIKGDKKAINPNLRASIFNYAAKVGDENTFEQLLDIYKTSESVEVRISALRALGRFNKPEILDKVVALLLQTDVIKQQDIYIPMQGLRAHKEGINKLWSWLTENWDPIYELIPPSNSMLGSIVIIATSSYTKQEQKEAVEKFFAEKDTKGYDQGLAKALDSVSAKIKSAKRDIAPISNWLSVNGYSK